MSTELLRQLPSVNDLLIDLDEYETLLGHALVLDAIRECLQSTRKGLLSGIVAPTRGGLLDEIRRELKSVQLTYSNSHLINATGIIIHTNLGRVVLSKAAQLAMQNAASAYQALEFDLETGLRGQRGSVTERVIASVTHAEDALIVNNCAAATVLMLSTVASGKAVVISRGELIEIGGGFRIPEILVQSGARLIEVGTTNRTRLRDYEIAIQSNPDVVAILCVHPSNFKIMGYTESAPLPKLTTILRTANQSVLEDNVDKDYIPVLNDLGSGALLDTSVYGLDHEPTPQESVAAGAVLSAFSGDKLVGGPQAGIIVGQREYVARCRSHPLARAFRADKYTLAGLGATFLHYARGEALREIPVWRMISESKETIHRRAEDCLYRLQHWLDSRGIEAEIIDGRSAVGGGSLPGETLPTALIALHTVHSIDLLKSMRHADIPLIARIKEEQVLLDLRTVLDDDELVAVLATV